MNTFQLDLRGYLCPLPLLMTKKALTSLQAGDCLVVQLNKTSSEGDFRALCKTLNYQLMSSQLSDDGFSLKICK